MLMYDRTMVHHSFSNNQAIQYNELFGPWEWCWFRGGGRSEKTPTRAHNSSAVGGRVTKPLTAGNWVTYLPTQRGILHCFWDPHAVPSSFRSARGLDGLLHWLQPHLPALLEVTRTQSPQCARVNASRPHHATMRLQPRSV